MTGRHRRARTTPARRALLGTVPLVGGAGVVTGLLTAPAGPPVRLQIEGMTCASCVGRVEKALKAVPGFRVVDRTQVVPCHGQLVVAVTDSAQNVHISLLQPLQLVAAKSFLNGFTQPSLVLGPDRTRITGQFGIVRLSMMLRSNRSRRRMIKHVRLT